MQNQLLILSTNKSPIYMDSEPDDVVILHDELDSKLLELGFRIWDSEYMPTSPESLIWVDFDQWYKEIKANDKHYITKQSDGYISFKSSFTLDKIPNEFKFRLLGGRLSTLG